MPIIYLIGMPGCGKSTIGKELAQVLDYHFFDLDMEIENQERTLIADIFASKGEGYFRRVESELLHSVSGMENNVVIATGGGASCFYDGIEFMNLTGTTVFINVNTSHLMDRIKAQNDRPLLKEDAEKGIAELYKVRITFYKRAKFVINTDSLSVKETVKQIQKELKLNTNSKN